MVKNAGKPFENYDDTISMPIRDLGICACII